MKIETSIDTASDAISAKGSSVLFSAVKNEAVFIPEWIAYHKVIGFDRIVLFSNDSDDGTTELLDALDAAGEIEHVTHSPAEGVSAQANAARLANARPDMFTDGDWVIWLDADEFLVVNTGAGRLDDLIEAVGLRRGMLIQWRVFGDSGHDRFPGRFVSEDFLGCALEDDPINRHIKMLFQMGKGVTGLQEWQIHRPRLDPAAGLRAEDFVTGKGRPIAATRPVNKAWLAGEEMAGSAFLRPRECGLDLAQINHYAVRTPEHFALKRNRGRGYRPQQEGVENTRHGLDHYAQFNRNESEDRRILRFADATVAATDKLLSDSGVAAAYQAASQRTKDAIEALDMPETQLVRSVTRQIEGFEVTLPAVAQLAVSQAYAEGATVFEFGSGGSSFIALRNKVGTLVSVESDAVWAEDITQRLTAAFPEAPFSVLHVDIGATRAWGRTKDSTGHRAYHRYANAPWDLPDTPHPDVVLIDGRFRVACFLATLFRCTRPVTVLFDDYVDRKAYHWIEDYAKPVALHDRMAEFHLEPTPLPMEDFTRIVGAFSNQD